MSRRAQGHSTTTMLAFFDGPQEMAAGTRLGSAIPQELAAVLCWLPSPAAC